MTGFNIADIIAILIVAFLIVWGIKKGFVKAIFSLGSLLISLILSLILYPPVTGFLAESALGDFVRLNVYKVLGADGAAAGDTSVLNLPEIFGTAIRQAETAAKETLANVVADLALTLLGIIIVFILVKILLWLVLKLLDVVTKLPIIRTANKLLGGAVGAVYGVLVIYLLLALLTFVTTLNATNLPMQIVQESSVVSAMYHNNILLNFLQ